jgi:hypothetical protein
MEMRKRVSICIVLVYLVLTMAVCVDPPVIQGLSPFNPAPVGESLLTKVEIGEGYSSFVESHDVKITVLKIVRGEKAWDLIKAENVSNEPPKVGFEYLLARIRFEYSSKEASGDKSYQLREDQFTATSTDGKEYENPSVEQPKPRVNSRVYPGDSLEGWVAFLVAKDDPKPLMIFGRYGTIWFQLY